MHQNIRFGVPSFLLANISYKLSPIIVVLPCPISTQIWSASNIRFEITGLTKLLLGHFLTINYSLARILQQVFSAIQEHFIPTQSLDSEQILLDC